MGKVKIEILPEVIDYLNNLTQILFDQEYFGFEETAQQYVQNIYDFMEYEIVNFPHKATPKPLNNSDLIMLFTKQITELLGIFSLKKRKIDI